MGNIVTKIWLFLVVAIIIALGIFVSVFFLVAVFFILLVTVPYFLYLKWKAKKEFEKYYEYEYSKNFLKDKYMEDD